MLTPTRGIEATRLFAIEQPLEYFSSMVLAVLKDSAISLRGIILRPALTGLIAKTDHAECGFTVGTGSQSDPILFIDLSFVELLQVVLAIVLPQTPAIPESAIKLLVERMLFHAAVQAGAYPVLNRIDPVSSLVPFGEAVFSRDISLRTMVGLDCLAGHELGHWRNTLTVDNARSLASFREPVMSAARAGFDRLKAAQQARYSSEDTATAFATGLSELAYWETDGWPEIECDLIGLQSAWATAHHLDVPVASLATTVATLFQLTSSLSITAATILGNGDAAGARNLSRSVVFESALVEMARFQGVLSSDWSYSVQYRKRANRRFVDLIAQPLSIRAKQLAEVYSSASRPLRADILRMMDVHRYAPRPAGHFYFCKMGVHDRLLNSAI